MRLRQTLASAGFLTALAVPAFAADPMVVPMTAPGFDWTGYYAGLQAGYGWGKSDIDVGGLTVDVSPDGGFVGGHVAGLWQFDQAVIGAEAELNYARINGTAEANPGNVFGTDIKWFGSVNAKAGFAMNRLLVYGVGGIAFADIETSQNLGPSFSETQTHVGWTVGAGVDYALTDKFVVGAQYRYYDFGSEHYDGAPGFTSRDQDVKLNAVSVNLSYKF